MAESSLWAYLKKGMHGHGHWVRIENTVATGTPDVNGAFRRNGKRYEVWIELKALHEWPKRESTPVTIKHFTDDQKQWLLDRHKAGGRAYVLVRVAREYFLFSAARAYYIGTMTRKQWGEQALAHYTHRIDFNDLRAVLCR